MLVQVQFPYLIGAARPNHGAVLEASKVGFGPLLSKEQMSPFAILSILH
jgi:hypothetical protein